MHVLPEILEQHAEDAVVLLSQRDRAIGGDRLSLSSLLALEERIAANLDGLCAAGKAGWALCEELLVREGVRGAFIASVVALRCGHMGRIEQVVQQRPRLGGAFVDALHWLPLREVQQTIARLAASEIQLLRHIGTAAHAVHGIDPGPLLRDAIERVDDSLLPHLLHGAAISRRIDLVDAIESLLSSTEERLRLQAAWVSLLWTKSPRALTTLIALTEKEGKMQEQAVTLLARSEECDALCPLWKAGSPRLLAVAMGAIGDPTHIPLLLEQMHMPECARHAADAFTAITGVELTKSRLHGERPEGYESGPSDDPEDDDVAPDPDDGLPWPDVGAVGAWWQQHKEEFSPRLRYLGGRPISAQWMHRVLQERRQRSAAATEMALLRRGALLFDIRAPAVRQQQWLTATA